MSSASPPTNDPTYSWQLSSSQMRRFHEIIELRRQPWAIDRNPSPEYRSDRLPEPYTLHELEAVMVALTKTELAGAFVHAAFSGDLAIAKRLDEAFGPIPVDLHVDGGKQTLNGCAYTRPNGKYLLGNSRSSNEVQKLMEWLPKVGFGWMVAVGSAHSELLDHDGLTAACAFVRKTWFEGELPSFANGKIEHPELLVALHEKQNHSAYPSVYDQVLCWVSESEIQRFPDEFVPYERRQAIKVNDLFKRFRPDESGWVPFYECTEEFLSRLENAWAAKSDRTRMTGPLKLVDLEMKTWRKDGKLDPQADMLLGHQANNEIRHGFWSKPGMVLCQAKVSFLSQFEMVVCQPVNEEAVQAFMSSYAPVDLIALHHADPSKLGTTLFNRDIGYQQKSQPNAINGLFLRIKQADALSARIKAVLPHSLVRHLAEDMGQAGVFDIDTIGTMYKEYGIDNSNMSVQLYLVDEIEKLNEYGYKFSETTWMFPTKSDVNSAADFPGAVSISSLAMDTLLQENYERIYELAIRMRLWPTFDANEPQSVDEALVDLAKRNQPATWIPEEAVACLYGYLRIAGLEECVKAAKTDKQWLVLGDVFGGDALMPYVQKAPITAQGALFGRDLGL